MSQPKFNPWLVVACAGGIFYPPLAYFGMNVLTPMVLVLIGLALIGIRLLGLRKNPNMQMWNSTFLIAAVFLVGVLFINSHLAVLVYPVIISLSVSCVFGLSLLFPPTLVERIARLSEPNLSPAGIEYTRKVTIIWTIFLFSNAVVSAITAIYGSLAQWTLWNGCISYLLMGTLFLSELVVRKVVRR